MIQINNVKDPTHVTLSLIYKKNICPSWSMISSKIFGERCTSNGVVPGHIVQEKLKKNKKWKEGEVGFRGFEKLIWMARDHGVGLIVVVCTKLISFTT